MESRRIISGERIKLPEPARPKERSPSISKDTSLSESIEEKNEKIRRKNLVPTKPKIISNERVNIQLDRFHIGQSTKRTGGGGDGVKSTTTSSAEVATTSSADQNEDVVKMLSKEILEQSKNINQTVQPNNNFKNTDDSLLKSSQTAVKESEKSNENPDDDDNKENNQSANLDVSQVHIKILFLLNLFESSIHGFSFISF